ncbi:MAG: potassium channel protein [Candidatus Kapaibacteriales bacterium]
MIFKSVSEYERLKLDIPVLPVVILITVIVSGTIGFYYLWDGDDASWTDALYMVMITITTIGYGEVHTLSTTGQIFTMLIAMFGIASLFYIFTSVMETLVFFQIYNIRGRKKLEKILSKMKNHYIIVGYGRVGRIVAKELKERNLEYIVIDSEFDDSDNEKNDKNFFGIQGDATDEATMEKAEISSAKALVVTAGDPATSTFIVLTARNLNPEIYIVARGDRPSLDSKLLKAGANRVINPYEAGGSKLANFAVNPNISDFIETNINAGDQTLRMERLTIPAGCAFIGGNLINLDIRKKSGVTVIAVIRDGKANLNPGGDYGIEQGDQLVVIGTPEQMVDLYKIMDINS